MIGCAAVHRLRHIGESRARITARPDMLYGIIGAKHIQQTVAELIVVDQILEI